MRDKDLIKKIIIDSRNEVEPWIPTMVEHFRGFSAPVMKSLLSYFVSLEIGGDYFSKYFKDEATWFKCWAHICFFFSGRADVKSEPDREEFLDHLKDYISNGGFNEAVAKADMEEDGIVEEEFNDLLEETGE